MSKQEHPCVNLDVDYIDQLIYSAKLKGNFLIKDELQKRCYGRNCDGKSKKKFQDLIRLVDLLQDEVGKLRTGLKSCFTSDQFQCIIENIRKKIGKLTTKKCVTVDECGVEKWLIRNPCCASKERWEKFAFGVCKDLKLNIEHVPTRCDFILELVREAIPMDIIFSLAICKEMQKDVDLKLIRSSSKELEIDFSLLAEKYPDSSIDFELYTTLVKDHKVAHFMIDKVLENKLSLELCTESENVILTTSFQRYTINDIEVDLDIIIENKEQYKKHTNNKDCESLDDPQLFLHKMYSDYR